MARRKFKNVIVGNVLLQSEADDQAEEPAEGSKESSDDDSSDESEENDLLGRKSKLKKRPTLLTSSSGGFVTPKKIDLSSQKLPKPDFKKSDYSFLTDKKTLTPKGKRETDNHLKSVIEVEEEDAADYSAHLGDDLLG